MVEPWETGVLFRSVARIYLSFLQSTRQFTYSSPLSAYYSNPPGTKKAAQFPIPCLHLHPAQESPSFRRSIFSSTAPLLPPLKSLSWGELDRNPSLHAHPLHPHTPAGGTPTDTCICRCNNLADFLFLFPILALEEEEVQVESLYPLTSVIVAAVDSIYYRQELATWLVPLTKYDASNISSFSNFANFRRCVLYVGCRFPLVTAYRNLDHITLIIDTIIRTRSLFPSLETER